LQHTEQVHVSLYYQIGNVAVHENFAGLGLGQLIGRYPAVGTPDPEDLRMLAVGKPVEEISVEGKFFLYPFAVVGQELTDKLGHDKGV
jgi:hypothetical protein